MSQPIPGGIPLVSGPVVLAASTDGIPVMPSPTPLTRLHFVDGRLLRGVDLTVEQNGQRALDLLLAQAGGHGVVWGLDVTRAGEQLTVSAGLAFDPAGRPLELTDSVQLSIATLLAAAGGSAVPAPTETAVGSVTFGPCELRTPIDTIEPVPGTAAYVLTAGWAEGYCGTTEIYGAACEHACVPSTDRPYRVDGVVFRLLPLALTSPLATSTSVLLASGHLRSRLASAYFADERAAAGPAMSAAQLASSSWCLGAGGPVGSEVPLALVVRTGQVTAFHDEWAVRRERLEPTARTAFDGRLAMRSRAVFAAQLAQFQCQLAERLAQGGLPGGQRQLIDAGIVELPPAGYLPVDPSADVVEQLTGAFGPGVDLRFVPRPAGQVAHDVEAVAHRNRIPLLPGLDNPATKPAVDVLVPDGTLSPGAATGRGFLVTAILTSSTAATSEAAVLLGTARLTPRAAGFAITAAGMSGTASQQATAAFVDAVAEKFAAPDPTKITVPIPTGSSQTLYADALRQMAAESGTFAEAVRAGETSEALPVTELSAEDPKPLVALASLTVERNPWQLAAYESAFLRVGLDFYAPGDVASSTTIEMLGQITPDASGATGAQTRALSFSGQLTVRPPSGVAQAHPLTLGAAVQLTHTSDGDLYTATWTVGGPTGTLRLGGSPFSVQATLGSMITVEMVEDQTALDLDAPARQLADVALQLLRALHPNEADFYERAKAAAFGTPQPGAAVVTATKDWVAFRRRPPEPPAPPPTPRTVQVWVHASTTEDDAVNAWKLLGAGNGGQVPWTRVRTVVFDPVSGVMQTAPAMLRIRYSATGAQPTIRFVGYGPATMPYGRSRAIAIVSALPPAARLDPGGQTAGVASPPAGFVDTDTDGSIFLIAAAPPTPTPVAQLQLLGFDKDQVSAEAKDVVAALSAKPPRADVVRAAVGTAVTDFGIIDISEQGPDSGQVEAAVNAANAAIGGRIIADGYPVLWLSADWAGANRILAAVVGAAAGEIAVKLWSDRGGGGLAATTELGLGIDPTPAVLLVVYSKG